MSIATYLNQCGVRAFSVAGAVKTMLEGEAQAQALPHVPPSAQEVRQLIAYLRKRGLSPVIVGSVAVFHHLNQPAQKYRPTVDLDIFVDKSLPSPLDGWRRDTESPGLESWIAPSGGYVDFMQRGHVFPSGECNPSSVKVSSNSPDGYPVAAADELLRMKLNSLRSKDLADSIALVRSMGKVPVLKGLNQVQRENLDLVRQWFEMRPHGAYGE